ncbi:hypothetical protein H0A35_04770 [Bacillus licheniformis]|uniref:hypothetical protein n=1 Tax=Bacillus licheniformis TaxID=1402 RepID=UPI0011A840D6|nr:hypothetical protein [Bacillus licheniformis]MBA1160328.1 hypothetical protein [Bacillus licheniformis]TWN41157.1 hypothetical protein CHCC14525_2478 [Bacillus licheniformis]
MNKKDATFDDKFPNGVFAIPRKSKESRVKVRKLFDYCQSKGVNPDELSEKEMEQFLDRKVNNSKSDIEN